MTIIVTCTQWRIYSVQRGLGTSEAEGFC